MFHLVYLAAKAVGDPPLRTEAGGAALIAVLRSLLQNCFLLDFTDYRFDQEVKDQVETLESAQVKLEVMRLLVAFKKRDRILRLVEDDYSGASDLELIGKCVGQVPLELVIIQTGLSWDEATTRVPSVTIIGFAANAFEARRSEEVAGRFLTDGEISGVEFIRQYLLPLMRLSRQVHIIDGVLGRYYHDDYGYTLDKLFENLRTSAPLLEEVTVHCELGPGKMPSYVEGTITELAKKHGLKAKVAVRFYSNLGKRALPHERFLASELGVVDIGRGFDFIAKKDGMLRNTKVGICASDTSQILGRFIGYRISHTP
jgi:hypothetical protein